MRKLERKRLLCCGQVLQMQLCRSYRFSQLGTDMHCCLVSNLRIKRMTDRAPLHNDPFFIHLTLWKQLKQTLVNMFSKCFSPELLGAVEEKKERLFSDSFGASSP